MRTSMKRSLTLALAVLTLLVFLPFITSSFAHAEGKLELGGDSIVIKFDPGTYTSPDEVQSLFTTDDSVKIQNAVCDDESIIKFYWDASSISAAAKKEGSCTITVTGENGDVLKVPVTVAKGWFKDYVDYYTELKGTYYSSRKCVVSALKGSVCTLKIGKDKYKKFTMGSKGEKTFKLKRDYKKGTKFSLKVKYKGTTITKKGSFGSITFFSYANSSKKKPKIFYVTCERLNKGDKVTVKYGGKTYSKKIKKAYYSKEIKFTLKKALKKNSTVTIIIYNKYKQVLVKEKVKLENWAYDYYKEEDEQAGSEE